MMMKTETLHSELLYQSVFESIGDGALVTDLETGAILFVNPAAAKMHGYAQAAFCELNLQKLLHPKSLPFFADYARVLKNGGRFEMVAQHACRDESFISVEWRAVAFPYQGRVCGLAVVRDVSKRVEAERQLHRRVGARAHEQAILLGISQMLASTLELQSDLLLDKLFELIQYSHAGLFALKDGTLVTLAAHATAPLGQVTPFCVQLDDQQTLDALFNGRHPMRIADIWGDEPTAKFVRALLEKDGAALLNGTRSWLWAPLAVKNRVIGGIGLTHAGNNAFTSHQADLMMTVANQVAVTLVNAELYEHAQTLAALQERQRLAQNLHDAVNQSLFSAGLIAEVLPRLWERDPVEARRALENLRHLTRGAQAEMRALLVELRPTTLIDAELGDLLRLLGNAFTGRTNILVDVTISGDGELPAQTQVALYRICQEALNNIAKHANASRVEIELCYPAQASDVSVASESLELRIRDNGRGFDADGQTSAGHYGLGMMRERAEAVAAEITVTSRVDQGTEIIIHWKKVEAL